MSINLNAQALQARVNKRWGDGSLVPAAELAVARRFTSGSLSQDMALGGGWPGNHWVEIFGKESHGKTAVVLKTIAANQAVDPSFTTLWVAAEHYDIEQAAALGVDNTRVLLAPTQQMEAAYQIMLDAAEARAADCIVLDSYPALIPDEEAEKDMDDFVVALGARLTGKFFRKAGKATHRAADERPMLGIIVNQPRVDVGGYSPHGPAMTTPGGWAKNFAFYVRVQVSRDDYIYETRPGKGKTAVGQVIKTKTVKNKSAAPQRVASVDFYFEDALTTGFRRGEYDTVKEIVTMGVLYDAITRAGAYFRFGQQQWLGRDAMVEGLHQDPALRAEVTRTVLAALGTPVQRRLGETDLAAAQNVGTKRVRRNDTAA